MTEQELRSYYKERKAEIKKQVKAGNVVFLGSEDEVSLAKVGIFLDMFSKNIRENNEELYEELKSMDQEQVIILRLNGLFDCLDLIAGKEEIKNTIESLLEEELENLVEEHSKRGGEHMKAIKKEIEKIRGSIELNGSYDISENMVIGKAQRIKEECYNSGNPEEYEELLAKLLKIEDNKIILVMSRPIINEYIVIEDSTLIKKHILMEIEDQIREELEESETF